MNLKKYVLLTALATSFAGHTFAQSINSIAGNSTASYSGDGGLATAAGLNRPKAVAVDGIGNVYIADADNNRIRKIDRSSGIITTISGNASAGYAGDGGPAISATLNRPNDIKFDVAGNLYISDADNHCIRKINTSGIIATVAGTGGSSGFSGDGIAATLGQLDYPSAIAVDAAGNLYIADEYNNRIRKVNTSGIMSTVAGTGATGYSGEGGPATAADIGFPFGLAVDGGGNLYVSLSYQNSVYKVSASGLISTFAGTGAAAYSGDGGPALSAEMDGQWGLAADGPGNVYIADFNNQRIRKVNTTGTISTVAGNGSSGFLGDGGPATMARLQDPVGVAVDPSGSVYIADYNNHRIRKVLGTMISPPTFLGGHNQAFTLCHDAPASPINSLLAVTDGDVGQTETWSVLSAPLHGMLAATYITTSTGSAMTPTGLSYAPAAGYSGTDSFTVRVADGTNYDTTKVVVTMTAPPNAGVITGTDSVCPASFVLLSNTAPSGVWSTSSALATVTSTGIVTGVTPGTLTISYTVTNLCGAASATIAFKVRTAAACLSGVKDVQQEDIFQVFPNPNSGNFIVNLSSATNDEVQLVITNMLGEKVKQLSIGANKETSIGLDVPAGMYFLYADTKNGHWSAKVLVAR